MQEISPCPPAPIRLIALDLDGTLLGSRHEVSARNRRALAAASAAGVEVVPCSGRALGSIPPQVLSLPGVRYVVTSAGGAAFDLVEDKELLRFPLPLQVVEEVLRETEAAGGCGECYTGRHPYTPMDKVELIRAHAENKNFPFVNRQPVADLYAWARENAAQVVKLNLMFDTPALREGARLRLEKRDDILLTSASAINLEVNAPGGGKGDALPGLGRLLGIRPAEMMACGDQTNDLSMLQAVGFSVAMGNAVPAVKAAASWQTADCDEDGVAVAVERFVLGAG